MPTLNCLGVTTFKLQKKLKSKNQQGLHPENVQDFPRCTSLKNLLHVHFKFTSSLFCDGETLGKINPSLGSSFDFRICSSTISLLGCSHVTMNIYSNG